MEDIIAGRFETDDEAKSAAASLSDFTSKDDIFIFFNNQPGAHDSDRSEAETDDRGAAKGAASGATTGAVAAGTVGTVVGGPGVGAVAAAVGGYTGSLAGTAGGLPGEGEGANKGPHSRGAGMMLAVRVANANDRQQIIDCLRQHKAEDIETARGKWAEGEWADFDPTALPHLVD